jgi:hypothetical protein
MGGNPDRLRGDIKSHFTCMASASACQERARGGAKKRLHCPDSHQAELARTWLAPSQLLTWRQVLARVQAQHLNVWLGTLICSGNKDAVNLRGRCQKKLLLVPCSRTGVLHPA